MIVIKKGPQTPPVQVAASRLRRHVTSSFVQREDGRVWIVRGAPWWNSNLRDFAKCALTGSETASVTRVV